MIDIIKYAMENRLLHNSAICNEEFRDFFEKTRVKNVVEIGVFKGMSTAFIAQYAEKVYAFDIVDYLEKYKVWYDLGVSNKIEFHMVKSRHKDNVPKNFQGTFEKDKRAVDIKSILDRIEFDIAFIDGEHTYENVKADFELVKKCGRVLFHDASSTFQYVHRFVKELKLAIIGNIAYWEK